MTAKLRAKLGRIRFCGLDEEVEDAIWKLYDNHKITVDDARFPEELEHLLGRSVDLADRAMASGAHPNVQEWTKQVLQFYSNFDSATDDGDLDWFVDQLAGVKSGTAERYERIEVLNERIGSLEEQLARALAPVEEEEHKRLISLYRLILGIAMGKFGYDDPEKRRNTVSTFERALHADFHVCNGTIRKIIEDAERKIPRS